MDQVPQQMVVDVTRLSSSQIDAIATIPDAVDTYLTIFSQQFSGKHGPQRKCTYLLRFVAYLEERNHSMLLADLTLEDGKAFLDTLVNAYDGSSLSSYIKRRYKSALRTFSRFLYQAALLPEEVFFALVVN